MNSDYAADGCPGHKQENEMYFMEPPRDIYGGNDRFKQLWRRSERYEVG